MHVRGTRASLRLLSIATVIGLLAGVLIAQPPAGAALTGVTANTISSTLIQVPNGAELAFGSDGSIVEKFVATATGGYFIRSDGAVTIRPTTTDVFQEAATAYSAGFREVWLGPGQYVASATLTPAAIILRGGGPRETIITWSGAGTAIEPEMASDPGFGQPLLGAYFEGFQLRGPGLATQSTGIKLVNQQRSGYLHNLVIRDFGTCVELDSTWQNLITYSTVQRCTTGWHVNSVAGEVNSVSFVEISGEGCVTNFKINGAATNIRLIGGTLQGGTSADLNITSTAVGFPKSIHVSGTWFEATPVGLFVGTGQGTTQSPSQIRIEGATFVDHNIRNIMILSARNVAFDHISYRAGGAYIGDEVIGFTEQGTIADDWNSGIFFPRKQTTNHIVDGVFSSSGLFSSPHRIINLAVDTAFTTSHWGTPGGSSPPIMLHDVTEGNGDAKSSKSTWAESSGSTLENGYVQYASTKAAVAPGEYLFVQFSYKTASTGYNKNLRIVVTGDSNLGGRSIPLSDTWTRGYLIVKNGGVSTFNSQYLYIHPDTQLSSGQTLTVWIDDVQVERKNPASDVLEFGPYLHNPSATEARAQSAGLLLPQGAMFPDTASLNWPDITVKRHAANMLTANASLLIAGNPASNRGYAVQYLGGNRFWVNSPNENTLLIGGLGSDPPSSAPITVKSGAQFVTLSTRLFQAAPSSAPSDSDLGNGQLSFYLNEGTNELNIRVRYSDGTLKTGTIALT